MILLQAQALTLFDLNQAYSILRGEAPKREPVPTGGLRTKSLVPVARLMIKPDFEHFGSVLPDAEVALISLSDDDELVLQFYSEKILTFQYEQPLGTILLEQLAVGIYSNLSYVIKKLKQLHIDPAIIGAIGSEILTVLLTHREQIPHFVSRSKPSLDDLLDRLLKQAWTAIDEARSKYLS